MKPSSDVIISCHPGLQDARVVMLCGISGSGKTHFARRLEELGFRRLSVDRLMVDTYGEEFQSLPKEEQWQLTADTERRIAEMACEAAGKGEKVVVDGCLCKRAKRDGMRATLRQNGLEPVLVHLKADFPTSLRRLEKRTGESCDDLCVSREMLSRFFEGFQPPDDDENAIVIDTSEQL